MRILLSIRRMISRVMAVLLRRPPSSGLKIESTSIYFSGERAQIPTFPEDHF